MKMPDPFANRSPLMPTDPHLHGHVVSPSRGECAFLPVPKFRAWSYAPIQGNLPRRTWNGKVETSRLSSFSRN